MQYAGFITVLDNYNQDAKSINEKMVSIDNTTDQLVETMNQITQAINSINQTMQESTIGITDIAQRNSNIGELTAQNYDMVQETTDISNELTNNISHFTL